MLPDPYIQASWLGQPPAVRYRPGWEQHTVPCAVLWAVAPAAGCTEWLGSLFLNSFLVYNIWIEPWVLHLPSMLFFKAFVIKLQCLSIPHGFYLHEFVKGYTRKVTLDIVYSTAMLGPCCRGSDCCHHLAACWRANEGALMSEKTWALFFGD